MEKHNPAREDINSWSAEAHISSKSAADLVRVGDAGQ